MNKAVNIYRLLDDYHISNEHLAPRKFRMTTKFVVKYLRAFIRHTFTFKGFPLATVPDKLQFRLGKLEEPIGLPTFSIYSNDKMSDLAATDLFYPYYLLNLAYLVNRTPLAKVLFKRAYRLVCSRFSNKPLTIYNAGPSLMNSLLTYYCWDHAGSRFYLIQHAVYQLCHRPYYYQVEFDSTTSWVWSQLQSDIHRAQGVKHVEILPNLKISSVVERAEIDWLRKASIVIIGESSDKYYADYNACFQRVVKQAMEVLRYQQRVRIGQVYFKPHPRTPAKGEWKEVCEREGWIYTEQMPETSNMIVVGAFSTYLIEMMARGYVGFQIQSSELRQLVDYDDYTQYTSLIPLYLREDDSCDNDHDQLDDAYFDRSHKPYIDPKYLYVTTDWADKYCEKVYGETQAVN